MEAERRSFGELLTYVRRQRGLDFGQYKETFLRRRLAVRMRACDVGSLGDYLAVLKSDAAEVDALLDALTINLSYFFRDLEAFDVLSQHVIAPLIAAQQRTGHRRLSVWSAGCASGEEPYSVAMLLAEQLGSSLPLWDLTIHATDIDAAALSVAKRAVFQLGSFSPSGDRISERIRRVYLDRYFEQSGQQYTVRPQIRRMVVFRLHDLTRSSPLLRYDLILCRNVLIYFAREHQEGIIQQMFRHLEPEGYLMLGMAETLPSTLIGRVDAVDARRRIYRRNSTKEEL